MLRCFAGSLPAGSRRRFCLVGGCLGGKVCGARLPREAPGWGFGRAFGWGAAAGGTMWLRRAGARECGGAAARGTEAVCGVGWGKRGT